MPTLTELRVKAAKPAEKPYKLFDQRGLFMLVTPAGGRLWRFRYKREGWKSCSPLASTLKFP